MTEAKQILILKAENVLLRREVESLKAERKKLKDDAEEAYGEAMAAISRAEAYGSE